MTIFAEPGLYVPVVEWWNNEPDPVRAVLDLANDGDDARRDRIAALLTADGMTAEQIAAEVRWLTDQTQTIGRLRSGSEDPALAREVISELLGGGRVSCSSPDEVADEMALERMQQVLFRAQLLASLITAGGARC